MTTATAQANPNIAFIKCTSAKLGRTNGTGDFDLKFVLSWHAFFSSDPVKVDSLRYKTGRLYILLIL
jgi:hypothetical protein